MKTNPVKRLVDSYHVIDGWCKRRSDATQRDKKWSQISFARYDWEPHELQPDKPSSEKCFASLLHGDKHEFFLYACILGRRLMDASPTIDRVLMCGPGCADNGTKRLALRRVGWTHLLPVDAIEATHLDQTPAKRHALVFTKLRVLELPYTKVLFLDLDLLPRQDISLDELFEVSAPAGKFHCSMYEGPEPSHGALIPLEMRQIFGWCPNAGVMRLDPAATVQQRRAQMSQVIQDVSERRGESYLPEQYYLAERLTNWRHMSASWNWEVSPEWDDPGMIYPRSEARKEARRKGWAGSYFDRHYDSSKYANEVCKRVRVWHFSGSGDTDPWRFQNLSDATAVYYAASWIFTSRDPGGVVATALFEWRQALDDLVAGVDVALDDHPIREAAWALAEQAAEYRARAWKCERCEEPSHRVREHRDSIWSEGEYDGHWNRTQWLCADCIVGQLRTGDFQEWNNDRKQ